MQIYLDSSAYLKGFRNEEKSEIVHDIMELCEREKLKIVISTWTLAECMSVIDKACNNNKISADEMDDMIKRMLAFSYNNGRKGCLVLVRPDWNMMERSFAYIRWYHLSADDSLHAMCANVPPADILVLADKGFSYMLKNPEEPRDRQELLERPKIHFKVSNLLHEPDFGELQTMLHNM